MPIQRKLLFLTLGLVEGRNISHRKMIRRTGKDENILIDPTKGLPVKVILNDLKKAAGPYEVENVAHRIKKNPQNGKRLI